MTRRTRRKPLGQAIYRPLLSEAWRIVWNRKSLWFFGIFATLVSTGGVFEIAVRAFDRVTSGRDLLQELLSGSIPGYDSLVEYIRLFSLMEPWRQTTLLAVFATVGVCLIVFGILSQGILILQAGAKKQPHHITRLLHRIEHFFWRLLSVDLVTKAVSVALLMAATLPLVLYVTAPSIGNGVVYVVAFLIFFPAVVVLNLLSVLSIVLIVEHDHRALAAIEEAMRLFRRHWVAMLELGLATFFISLAIMAISMIGTAVLFVGTSVLLALAVMVGSGGLYIWSAVLGAGLMALVFLISSGLMTAYQYTVWLLYCRRAQKPHGIVGKLERWWARLV